MFDGRSSASPDTFDESKTSPTTQSQHSNSHMVHTRLNSVALNEPNRDKALCMSYAQIAYPTLSSSNNLQVGFDLNNILASIEQASTGFYKTQLDQATQSCPLYNMVKRKSKEFKCPSTPRTIRTSHPLIFMLIFINQN